MSSEAKETARLYALLTDKLGGDTTEAMFNYIDTKAERAVESKIQSLATKNDLFLFKDELLKEIGGVKDELHRENSSIRGEMTKLRYDLSKDIGNSVKWMFIFWIGQVGAILAMIFLFLKK